MASSADAFYPGSPVELKNQEEEHHAGHPSDAGRRVMRRDNDARSDRVRPEDALPFVDLHFSRG